jgi:hypothetical protein
MPLVGSVRKRTRAGTEATGSGHLAARRDTTQRTLVTPARALSHRRGGGSRALVSICMVTLMMAALSLMLTFGPAAGAAPGGDKDAASGVTVPRVRAMSASARALLVEALTRSGTIARLVQTLQSQRVYVFVDTRLDPDVPTGETSLLTENAAGRYVRVILNPALTRDRRIELLGHELQHALEIARADDVHDGPSLRRHYSAMGRALEPSNRRHQSFETDAAQDVELQVRRDLRGGIPDAI